MPFYTFKCTSCEEQKDYLVKMGTSETDCSKCGEKALKQLSFNSVALGLPNGHFAIRSKSRSK